MDERVARIFRRNQMSVSQETESCGHVAFFRLLGLRISRYFQGIYRFRFYRVAEQDVPYAVRLFLTVDLFHGFVVALQQQAHLFRFPFVGHGVGRYHESHEPHVWPPAVVDAPMAFQLGLCDIRFGKESRIYRGIVQHVVPEPDVVDLGMVDRGRFQTCLPDDRV